jgi:fumarate hydratase class II
MPGKVNPVIPEATCMVCAQVIGHHAAITVAGQSGNFQLNVMLPLIALRPARLDRTAGTCHAPARRRCDRRTQAAPGPVREALDRNPILVTALNPIIGYEKAAAIAKQAYKEGRAVLDVAVEATGLPEKELRRLLDPAALTRGGIQQGGGGGGGG